MAGAVGGAKEPIDWSGAHWGISGGLGWGTSDMRNNFGIDTGNYDLRGGLIGLTGGYNWQLANIILGVEADASLSTIKGSTLKFCGSGCQTDLRWLGTLRAKAGYPIGKFMPYATGGLAIGDVKASVATLPDHSKTQVGWTAGAGLAYAFTTGFSVKAEYLYTDLGSFSFSGTGVTIRVKADEFQTARIGLDFAF
jgi:outer membrane immunogenic protein